MEEYLEKLLAQIRCKKARPYIAEEIRGHIESQIEDNIARGFYCRNPLFIKAHIFVWNHICRRCTGLRRTALFILF